MAHLYFLHSLLCGIGITVATLSNAVDNDTQYQRKTVERKPNRNSQYRHANDLRQTGAPRPYPRTPVSTHRIGTYVATFNLNLATRRANTCRGVKITPGLPTQIKYVQGG